MLRSHENPHNCWVALFAATAEARAAAATAEAANARRDLASLRKEGEVEAARQRAALVGSETLAEECRAELANQAAELATLRAYQAEHKARAAGVVAGWEAEVASATTGLSAKQQAVERLSAALSESEAERTTHAEMIRGQLQQIDRLSLRLRLAEVQVDEGGRRGRAGATEAMQLGDRAARGLAGLKTELQERELAVNELGRVVKRQVNTRPSAPAAAPL